MTLAERPEPEAAGNSIPGHEPAGVVSAFGETPPRARAEYVAVEARNLAPLPGDVDFPGARVCRSPV
ncbi:hypothetical protein GCM10014715_52450 [Streptomyces spiralis]|uniref:Uncharacterized protein n=1 Tax=Streptomyces spiralis TaxID=66376 RepID=A0A919A746_9ACTN|nr:hypothetical protein GCM10014715_52450 [Streptomyces spiralis]